MNKSLGFLQTSRARGKVRAWFNVRDHETHLEDGKSIVERELKRLNAKDLKPGTLARRFNLDKTENMYVSIGRGDISQSKVAAAISALLIPEVSLQSTTRKRKPRRANGDSIAVGGVGSLLTQMAACCNPCLLYTSPSPRD